MTSLGWLSIHFFFIWTAVFLSYSIYLVWQNYFHHPSYRTLWTINLGAGFGILLYNYEVEQALQSHISNLGFSMSSARVLTANLLTALPYYLALKRLSTISFPSHVFALIMGHTLLVMSVDLFCNVFFTIPYPIFQVWMTLLIVPSGLCSAAIAAPITQLVIRDEKNQENRARFIWWIFELVMATLAAGIFWIDAIYRVVFGDYSLHTLGTTLGILCYLLLILGAVSRIILPQSAINYVLYPEKLWTYCRLRSHCRALHQLVNLPEMYRYQHYFWPSLYNLEREILRSVVSISDISRLLKHHPIYNQLAFLRNPQLTTEEAIRQLLKLEVSP